MAEPTEPRADRAELRFERLELTNFLSYRSAAIDFADLVALVGPNASGKSNAVAAVKLLRDIAGYGLPIALQRRGGFDQLRHRSSGRPYDPALRLTFRFGAAGLSFYDLKLGALKGGRYRVKAESARVQLPRGPVWTMVSNGSQMEWSDDLAVAEPSSAHETPTPPHGRVRRRPADPGQSSLFAGGTAGLFVSDVLRRIQPVEINPAKVAELQEPSSTSDFEPDGSNVVSFFENLPQADRALLVDDLAAVVPGIVGIEVARFADMQTLRFRQQVGGSTREFYAKQMSDGTLRAFAILLAARRLRAGGLLVVEEPEVAIHLGALRTLVELLRASAERQQVVLTTHSADIVDALPLDSLRVVWSAAGSSHLAPVSEHSKEPIRQGLITPGELLRSDSLDPAV